MANESQARRTPEREISVDLSEGDPSKAVSRHAPRSDIASQVRDDDDRGGSRGSTPQRSKTEDAIFKRMTRMQRSMTKQFNQQLADSEAKHQREIAALRQSGGSGVSIDRDAQALKDAHEKLMDDLTKALTEAQEKGDSAEAAKITAKMIRADGEYHAKLAGTAVRRDAGGVDPNAGGAGTGEAKPKPAGPTPAGSRFILANEDWWEDSEFEIEKAAASTIFIKLLDEGFTSNSEETFKEVAKRLKAKFPELEVKVHGGKRVGRTEDGAGDGNGNGDDGGDDLEGGDGRGDGDDGDGDSQQRERQRERRAPSGRFADRGAGSGRNDGNRRTLTSEEVKTMRLVGLNPDIDKDVISFLKEAVAMENARR